MHPEKLVIQVKDTDKSLVLGADQFGCIELSINRNTVKTSYDISLSNTHLSSNQIFALKIRAAFCVDLKTSQNTINQLVKIGYIQEQTVTELDGQSVFSIEGELLDKWNNLNTLLATATEFKDLTDEERRKSLTHLPGGYQLNEDTNHIINNDDIVLTTHLIWTDAGTSNINYVGQRRNEFKEIWALCTKIEQPELAQAEIEQPAQAKKGFIGRIIDFFRKIFK